MTATRMWSRAGCWRLVQHLGALHPEARARVACVPTPHPHYSLLGFRVLSIPPRPLIKGGLAFCVAGLLRAERLQETARRGYRPYRAGRGAPGVPPLSGVSRCDSGGSRCAGGTAPVGRIAVRCETPCIRGAPGGAGRHRAQVVDVIELRAHNNLASR